MPETHRDVGRAGIADGIRNGRCSSTSAPEAASPDAEADFGGLLRQPCRFGGSGRGFEAQARNAGVPGIASGPAPPGNPGPNRKRESSATIMQPRIEPTGQGGLAQCPFRQVGSVGRVEHHEVEGRVSPLAQARRVPAEQGPPSPQPRPNRCFCGSIRRQPHHCPRSMRIPPPATVPQGQVLLSRQTGQGPLPLRPGCRRNHGKSCRKSWFSFAPRSGGGDSWHRPFRPAQA